VTDEHDRAPVDQATIDCWRVNYGLDKRTPAEAAKWWSNTMYAAAPSGCVAALGIALDELEAMRKASTHQSADALDAARYRWLRGADSEVDGCALIYCEDALDAAIDAAMAKEST